jgi:hypothetical protein
MSDDSREKGPVRVDTGFSTNKTRLNLNVNTN